MAQSNIKQIFRLSTRQQIQPILPQETTAIQYASTWFQNNLHKKPQINISFRNVPTETLLQHAAAGLETGDLTGELASAVLYRIFREEKQHLQTEWLSFNIQIGKTGDEITPWTLVDVQEKDGVLPNAEINKKITAKDADWIAFYICFLYRYSRATNLAYKDALFGRAEEHAKNLNPEAVKPSTPAMTRMQAIILHAPFNACIATLDMYYHKFKNTRMACIRFGTLPSRYKDCAALTTLNHITRLTGLPIEQFMLWVFSARMADELDQMSKQGEELEKGDSYVAYMRELGVSERSPYSAQANPAFSLFCHVVGTLLGSKRSKNAKMGVEVDTVNSVINGKIVAYILGTRPTLTLEYGTNPDIRVEGTSEIPMGINKPPSNAHPEEWFGYLSMTGFRVPVEAEKWVESRLATLTDLRDGTVGKFLKTQK
ncbi:nucleocapsid [Wuhan Louse Fly Virus 5]|uniref:Nucleoprotein n=1 Tax=Wuhan Louse Fly Virus 5 TaxID=1608119 RepID=A0A0B5KTP0_9RHAB|nr:nucleocapsid [Wuhan Louse Fly Virus 5]AJG39197.1 nucleocapsid [Wuhan Louse Fly Virus 5]